MPGSAIIGRVAVKVVPDTKFFRKDAKAKLEAAAKDLRVEVPTTLDTKTLPDELRRALHALQAYADAKPIKIRTKFDRDDLRRARDDLRKATRDQTQRTRVKVDVDPDTRVASRELALWRGKEERKKVKVDVDVDNDPLNRIGHKLDDWFKKHGKKKIDVDFDEDQLRRMADQMSRVFGQKVDSDYLRKYFNDLKNGMRGVHHESDQTGKGLARLGDETHRAGGHFQDLGRDADGAIPYLHNLGRAGDDLGDHLRNLNRDADDSRGRFRRWGNSIRDTMRSAGRDSRRWADNLGRGMQDVGRVADRFGGRWDRMMGRVGRSLGRGSRNNFLHFFAGLTTGIISLPVKILTGFGKALGKVGEVISTFATDGFSAGMKSLGSAAMAGLPGLISLAAVIASLTTIIPILILFIGQLAAVMTSILGAVVIGLIGMALPLIPILLSLGAAIGVVVGAVMSMKDNKGNWLPWVSKAFAGVKKEVDGLKKSLTDMAKSLAPTMARLAGTVLGGLKGLVSSYGDSIRRVMDNLDTSLNDPKEKKFLKAWGDAMPKIFESVGKGINSLSLAFLNFFAPILPYAQRLADKFQEMADKFLAWTQSAEGQNSIKDFMSHAWEDAKKLGNAIKNVTTGISKLFDMGSKDGGGDSFLTKLEGWTKSFDQWAGSKKAEDFFKKAKDNIKEFAKGFGGFVDSLKKVDWEQTNSDLHSLGEGFKTAGKWAERLGAAWEIATAPISGWSALAGSLDDIGSALSGVWGWCKRLGDMTNPLSWMDGLGGSIKGIDWSGMWGGITSGLGSAKDFVLTTMESIGTGVSDAVDTIKGLFSDPFQAIKDKIVAPFQRAWEILLGHSIIPDIVNGITDWINGLPGKIAGALLNVGAMLVSPFASALPAITTAVSGMVVSVATGFGSMLASAASWTGSMVATLASGIASSVATVATGFGSMVASAASGFGSMVVSAASGAASMAGSIASGIGRMIGSVSSGAASMAGSIASGAASMASSIASGSASMASSIASGAASMASSVASGTASMIGSVASAAGSMISSASSAASGLVSAIGSGINQAVSLLGSLPGRAASALSSLGGTLVSAGSSLIGGFISGISSRIGDVSGVLGKITSMLPSWKGPPRTDATILIPAGRLVIQGFVRGIKAETPAVRSSLQSLTSTLADTMSGALDLADTGKSAMQSLADGMVNGLRPVEAAMGKASATVGAGMTGGVQVPAVASADLYAPAGSQSTGDELVGAGMKVDIYGVPMDVTGQVANDLLFALKRKSRGKYNNL